MSFIWPTMLAGLMVVPLLVVGYLLLQRRRRRIAARYSSMGFVQHSHGRPLGARRHIPPVLFLVAITVLLVAMARPQSELFVPRLEGTIILAFDVSGSMSADDIQPTRLEAAKKSAREFVSAQPSTIRIGVVTFSEGGFSTQSPTNNTDEVLAAIDRLSAQRGTSLARGIEAGLNVIIAEEEGEPLTLADPAFAPTAAPLSPVTPGTYTSSVIVLLSDGENTQDPDPMDAARAAAERGIRVYAIGIGTTDGAILALDGFQVRSRLEEGALQQIADYTGGEYKAAQNEQDFKAIYNNIKPEITIRAERTEITALVAGIGIAIMMVAGTFSMLWLGRLP